MKSSLWSIQKAEYARLNVDLNAIVNGVYDKVPDTAVIPYVVIGEVTVTSWKTKDSQGEEATATLHCYSNYAGKKEAYNILSAMLNSLTNQPLSLDDGFSLVNAELSSMNVITDADGTSYHGILRIKYIAKN